MAVWLNNKWVEIGKDKKIPQEEIPISITLDGEPKPIDEPVVTITSSDGRPKIFNRRRNKMQG